VSPDHGTDTRSRIQSAALELFIQQGFSATSLQQVADRVGVTKAALYYHFPSKSDLARSIFIPWKEDLDRFLDEAEADPDRPRRQLIGEAFDVLVRHREAFTAMMTDGSILKHVDLLSWTKEWAERLQGLFIDTEPTMYKRVRVSIAFGGLNDAIFLLGDAPVEVVKPAAIDAVCAAIGIEDDSSTDSSPLSRG
jgi:AcrR family transcriptional regulator